MSILGYKVRDDRLFVIRDVTAVYASMPLSEPHTRTVIGPLSWAGPVTGPGLPSPTRGPPGPSSINVRKTAEIFRTAREEKSVPVTESTDKPVKGWQAPL